MKFSGGDAEKFCRNPKPGTWACLIFGEDEGVCADAGHHLRAQWAKSKEIETLNWAEEDIRRDPAAFHDALEARALLGGAQLIRVRTNGDKIASILLDALKAGEAGNTPPENHLLVEAGPLKTRSKLRTGFEVARLGAALHVFADETHTLDAMTKARLASDGISIDSDALGLFIANLPGHRNLANMEIEKVALFGRGLERPINLDDIRQISATEIEQGIGEIVSAALSGRTSNAIASLERVLIAGTSPISILRALQREAQRLIAAHALAGQGGEIGMRLKPPVYKSAWPTFRSQMQRWPTRRLVRVLERIHDAEYAAKQGTALAEPALQKLILDLAKASATSASNR